MVGEEGPGMETRVIPDSVDPSMPLAVCGAHMRGLPLNHQLLARGAVFRREARTAPVYRLFLLEGPGPARPGLVRGSRGATIALEIWDMPSKQVGSLLALIPAPLGLGRVALDDGSEVTGFLCEGHAAETAYEITASGGWRAYLESIA